MTVLEKTPKEELSKLNLSISQDEIYPKILYEVWRKNGGVKDKILESLRVMLDGKEDSPGLIDNALKNQKTYTIAKRLFGEGKLSEIELETLETAYRVASSKAIRLNNTIRFFRETKPGKAIERAKELMETCPYGTSLGYEISDIFND